MDKKRNLNAALITSFNPNVTMASPDFVNTPRLRELCWPRVDNSALGLDVYLMMESDVRRWGATLGISLPHISAFSFFQLISIEHCRLLAQRIHDNARQIGSPIVALTSFFPEINLSSADWRGNTCSRVLESLVRIAAELALLNGTAPVIQLVAGSLISHFESIEDECSRRRTLYARRGNESVLMSVVLERIAEALHAVSVEYHGRLKFDACMRVALELEPGPLYLLRDRDTLLAFRQAIEDLGEPIVDACVGYNLDVAHWWLAQRINAAWLRSNPRIAERVFHAHISGHSPRGHFGDISLARLHPEMISPFKEWLSEIACLPNVHTVSLEMEAARSLTDVEESIQTLQVWLREINHLSG